MNKPTVLLHSSASLWRIFSLFNHI